MRSKPTTPLPISAPAAALVGLALLLGVLSGSSSARADDIVHVIQKGQNLGMIARRYHTSVEAIVAKNKLKPRQMLKPGQKLLIAESEEHQKWRAFYERQHGRKPPEQRAGSAKAEAAGAEKDKARKVSVRRASGAERPEPETARAERKGKPSSAEPAATKNSDPYARAPKRPGYVILTRHQDTFRGQLVDARGRTLAASTKRIDRLLRSRRTGEKHRINRRLLSLLADVSDHFGGRTIIVVSGYRPSSTNRFTRDSRHNHGEAIDFRIVGVPNDVVFAYCKRFPNVGCGYYPNSHFVHMDVRKRKTQWIDYSRPGQAPIYAHRMKKSDPADASDAKASSAAAAEGAAAEPADRAEDRPPRRGEPPEAH